MTAYPTRTRVRSLVLTAVVLAAGASLTACEEEEAASAAAASAAAASASPAGKSGVSGVFAGGVVEYLAPGKYIVSVQGKDQQFFVTEDTRILGAGAICGQSATVAATTCTEADLEKITTSGSVAADVVLKSGAAVTITERPAPDEGDAVDDSVGSGSGSGSDSGSGTGSGAGSGTSAGSGEADTEAEGIEQGKGVNATITGGIEYLAPGAYIVSGTGGDQKFLVSDDTEILGAGDGGAWTEAELESAAKKGDLFGTVEIVNGIAVSVHQG
ncbi:hypothetical protein ACIPSE_32030 [Streptomyces sp. NPDC090106]|uniref:hypothetical protein n=1 Tax=Streptomyces sp. NPDC090106 TaxID=3365946 RepID=UPI00382AF896